MMAGVMSAVRLRLLGLLLFLPVPLVLALFTRQPLGTFASLAAGLLLMASHRLYARPFALRHAAGRCLWCGGGAGAGQALRLREPQGETGWSACSGAHRQSLRRVLGWAGRRRRLLQLGVLGGLAVVLLLSPAAALGRAGGLQPADAVAGFQLLVALAVLPLSLLGPLAPPAEEEPLVVPFPVHLQALIGTWAVLWLFRLVGAWWLWAGLRRLLARA